MSAVLFVRVSVSSGQRTSSAETAAMTRPPIENPAEHRTSLETNTEVSLSGGFLLRLNLAAKDGM